LLREQLGRADAGGRRDDDVGAQAQVRAVGLRRADRNQGDDGLPVGDQAAQRLRRVARQELLRHGTSRSPVVVTRRMSLISPRRSRSINSFLSSFPRSFFGRSSTNTTQRGYLCFDSRACTWALSSSASARWSRPLASGRSTTTALGLVSPA